MRGKKLIYLLGFLIVFSFLLAVNVEAEEKARIHEESFSKDYDLKGLFATCEEFFHGGEWEIEEAKFTLFYTATTLVREEVSDFTILLNGEPIYSQKIPLTGGETQKLTITLPERLIKEGTNSIRLESYIRTNESDPCAEDVSGASWMVVRKDSYVSIHYKPTVSCSNVADVYKQLTSIEGLENNESTVFLPDIPTENELTSAAYLLSGLSKNAVISYENLGFMMVKDISEISSYDYGIYLSEYDRLPSAIRSLMKEEHKIAALSGAVIVYVKMNQGTDLLVITGRDEKALKNACRLLGNKPSMEQTKALYRRVSSIEDVNVIKESTEISVLTQTGNYISGPFKQTIPFTVSVSANKCIAAGSEVEIDMRYAQNLDFSRSLVTVYLEDTPIGSKKLEKDSANGDVLKVKIPDNLNISGNFMLNVTFDLEMKDLICDVRKQDMPWAYITNKSTLRLQTQEMPWLLFDNYPGPFIQEGRFNNVTVILPVKESKEDIESFRKILLTMGRYQTDNGGSIQVCRANNMGDLTAANVISIGCYMDNPIVQQINNQLYFQFSPDKTTICSNEKMKIEPNYGAVLGTAQLLYSPYSEENNALLIVSGVTREGMLCAAEFLGNVKKNWQIYGDGFVADGEYVNCYRFGEDNNRKNSFLYNLTEQNNVVIFLVIGASVLVLMIISLIMIWLKHRRKV